MGMTVFTYFRVTLWYMSIIGRFATYADARAYCEYMQKRHCGDFTVVPADVIDINDTLFEQYCEDDMYIEYQFDDEKDELSWVRGASPLEPILSIPHKKEQRK